MSQSIRSILSSTYAKILFAGIVGFCGVVGGMYVGSAIVNQRTPTHTNRAMRSAEGLQEVAEPFVDFGPGDLFPHETLWYTDGQVGNFQTFLSDSKAILLFVSFDCGPCLDLLRFWNTRLQKRVLSDVKVVACLERSSTGIPSEYVGLFSRMEVIFYDIAYWRRMYNMTFRPVIVGVDDNGFVIHVQFGFADFIDYELIDYFFKPN